ncbi:hypothetical protein [Citrobacter farmeri]|uniref:hypothetical protein n=1 Tax=Citrobacter farmeri TaxID=67824 RepID=UPI0036238BCB
MRKNKGDITYYLENNSGEYLFIKKIKCRIKKLAEGKSKTTKKTVSEFSFRRGEVDLIDFTSNGLRPSDKEILIMMINELDEIHQ